jgi:16S rRNA (guanine(966)-N(2))-methyltransferase RsmD
MNSARIIAGELKGRKIALPNSALTRPTKAIVRESLFNTLGDEITGRVFAEIFAGSGSVGLEALSRGAHSAIFIERSAEAIACIQDNLKALRINDRARIFSGDSFAMFAKARDFLQSAGQKAWFYFDPPFDTRDGQAEIYQQIEDMLAQLDCAYTLGAIVEHNSQIAIAKSNGAMRIFKRRAFGKTALSYYRY